MSVGTTLQLYRAYGLWAVALLSACRIGGPSGDPFALVEPVSDAEVDATVDAGVDEPDALAEDSGAPLSIDAGEPDALIDASDEPDAEPTSCTVATPWAVCDPMAQTGCIFSQCTLDPGKPHTGRCVLGVGAQASGCSEDALSTSCDAGSGCVAGACRPYCYCDAHCATGKCCADPLGADSDLRFCSEVCP